MILNGVEAGVAGFDAIGTTVTSVGTEPPKLSFVAGSKVVAGIVASVAPLGIVASRELGKSPAVIVADPADKTT